MAAALRRPAAWAARQSWCCCPAAPTAPTSPASSPARARSESAVAARGGRFPPQPTNPELPVVGEAIWVSGFSQLPVTFRIAVHAVRRVEGATVLDWSVTPIAARGSTSATTCPGPSSDSSRRPARAWPCRCSTRPPTWRTSRLRIAPASCSTTACACRCWLQPDLRIGETRLLQIAFPALPPSLAFVDVNISTVAPIRHVPVSPVGTAPVARQPTDLARPGDVVPPVGDQIDFRNPSKSDQRQRIQVTRVVVAPGRATLEWTLTSLDGQPEPGARLRGAGGQHAAGRGAGGELQSGQWAGPARGEDAPVRRSGRAPAGTTGPRTSASARRSASGRPGCVTRP